MKKTKYFAVWYNFLIVIPWPYRDLCFCSTNSHWRPSTGKGRLRLRGQYHFVYLFMSNHEAMSSWQSTYFGLLLIVNLGSYEWIVHGRESTCRSQREDASLHASHVPLGLTFKWSLFINEGCMASLNLQTVVVASFAISPILLKQFRVQNIHILSSPFKHLHTMYM